MSGAVNHVEGMRTINLPCEKDLCCCRGFFAHDVTEHSRTGHAFGVKVPMYLLTQLSPSRMLVTSLCGRSMPGYHRPPCLRCVPFDSRCQGRSERARVGY